MKQVELKIAGKIWVKKYNCGREDYANMENEIVEAIYNSLT